MLFTGCGIADECYVMLKKKLLSALIDVIDGGLPALETLVAVLENMAEFLLDVLQLNGHGFTLALDQLVAFRRLHC